MNRRFFLAACAMVTVTVGAMAVRSQSNGIPNVIPGNAMLVVKTATVDKLVQTLNSLAGNFLEGEQKQQYDMNLEGIKQMTGFDLRNPASLRAGGIDTGRGIYGAYLPGKEDNSIVICLPVTDEKTFAMKFVQVMQQSNPSQKGEFPVVTPYRDKPLSQHRKDMFTAVVDGFFVLAPRSDLVKLVIDQAAGKGSRGNDAFMAFIGRERLPYDIQVFGSREFIQMIEQSRQQGGGNQPYQPSPFVQAIDFAEISLGLQGSNFLIHGGVQTNQNNPTLNAALGLFNPGLFPAAVFDAKAGGFIFAGLNYEYLFNLCQNPVPFCDSLGEITTGLRDEFGIDARVDLAPRLAGGVSMLLDRLEKGKEPSRYLVFFPTRTPDDAALVFKTLDAKVKEKHAGAKRYGAFKLGKSPGFWYQSLDKKKVYVVSDARGFYLSGDQKYLGAAIKNGTVEKMASSKYDFRGSIATAVFYLAARNNDFMEQMMKMQSGGNPMASQAISRVGDVMIRADRDGGFVSIDIGIGLKGAPPARKK